MVDLLGTFYDYLVQWRRIIHIYQVREYFKSVSLLFWGKVLFDGGIKLFWNQSWISLKHLFALDDIEDSPEVWQAIVILLIGDHIL